MKTIISTEPTVSVIMPAYNAKKYIAKAIDSVNQQTGAFPIELLVIDDGSTDQTKQIVMALAADCNRIELIYLENEQNLGVAKSRNRGILEAKGEYVAFLDADDWWVPEKLEQQIQWMEQQQLTACCTARELMHADGTSTGRIIPVPKQITYTMLLKTNSIPFSSAVVKTEKLKEFTFCQDQLHEDYIFWLKLLKKYDCFYGINQPMLKSRLSENGKSRNKLKSAKMQYGVYRYIGYGRLKSLFYFIQYVWYGLKKYYG